MNYDDEEIEEVDEELDDSVEDMLDDVSEVQFADEEEEKKEEEIIEEEEEDSDYSSIYPEELNDERLEYIFVGLLLNNPKAISMYYFLYEDCHFANQELLNIYKSVIFREGEEYIPAAGKLKFTFPNEDGRTYD